MRILLRGEDSETGQEHSERQRDMNKLPACQCVAATEGSHRTACSISTCNFQTEADARRGPLTAGAGATAGGGGYRIWWEARVMPSFFIRLRRVFGCSPRIRAAPRGPSITQSV